MRAAVLTEHGQAPAYAEHPEPDGGDGLVVVRMTAAPVVPLDLLCASGTSYFGAPALPYVPGVQGVGELDDGTRVWVSSSAGMAPGDGTLAEQCVVRSVDVVPIVADLEDTAVAALGLSGVAAWGALVLRAQLQTGERVAVLGAGGAVGQAAIGVAKARGAARVVGVCRPGASAERAHRAGADEVVELPADQDTAALVRALQQAADGPLNVVVDPVFGWVGEAATRALAAYGRLVNLGGSAGDTAPLSSAVVRGKTLAVLGDTNHALTPEQRAEALTGVVGLAADGLVRVEHRVRPLAEIDAAWAEVASGSAAGRQVLTP